jgi:hypothetical protein
MDPAIRTQFANLRSADGAVRYSALMTVLEATDRPVRWAYEVWDELLEGLRDKNAHYRAIAAQVLCNLAKSDPEKRLLKDFEALLAVTRDEKFVTARHSLQAIWKVGAAGKQQQKLVVERLADRFRDCAAEKNCTLVRFDIVEALRKLYDEVTDEAIRQKALALIETEPDAKYRKKYAAVWKRS